MNRILVIGVTTGLLCGAVVAAVGTPALAAGDYYVSPSGSNSNNGTSASSAFATIQQALDVAESGATIHLAAGRYLQDAVTRRAGVTVTGPATAVVSGAGAARIIQVRHDDVTLSGFTVDGLVGSASSESGYRDKLIYAMSTTAGDGVARLRILGMTIKNAGGECVRLRYLVTGSEVSDSTIGPCGAYDFKFDGGGKNGEGVYIGTAPEQQGANGAPDGRADVSRANRVHHNTFNTQGNECVDIKENSTANVVEHNTCTGQRDPESAGFDSRGSGNTFRYNVSRDNTGAGIRFGGDTPTDGTNNDAYGNTITGNDAGGIKFQATPQRQVCGNTMSGNPGGNAVGTYGSRFNPTAPCSGGTPPAPSLCGVTASGHDGNVPANAVDGDLATRWSAEGDGVWIRLDLCASVSLDHVMIAWHRGDQRAASFAVQTSATGSSWTTRYTGESSGGTVQPERVELPDHTARYLRVVGYGNEQNDWTSITELRAYGP